MRLARVRGANATATWTRTRWECVTTSAGAASSAWATRRASTASAASGVSTATPCIPQPGKNANVRDGGLFLSFLGRMCRHHYLNPFDGDNYASTSLEWYHTLPISGPGERYKRALRLLQFAAIQIISRTATLASCFRSFSCTLTSFLPFHTTSIRTLLDSHHHQS